ncbi:unnamed protein product [Phytomonas sp. Hart1]|nr:unnamed protein product [Phytomonas sp. Hart1]|eukprot:CCW70206.1 unnamed protein product [Phytomonas sp. isolate Hart1]
MFGELICGPPGSGKTTYCEGKRQFLSVYDPTRPVVIVNLDPANEGVFPYPCDVDIRELVSHRIVMDIEHLGPNGSYLFCAEVMQNEINWLIEHIEVSVQQRIQEMLNSTPPVSTAAASFSTPSFRAPYLLIDCPGQVEFYLNSTMMCTLFTVIQKRLHCSLCTVHLIDAGVATRDLPTYVSSCVLSLSTMIDHELPHVNVLTKWDTLDKNDLLENNIDERSPYLFASDFMTENFDNLWQRQLQRKRRLHHLATSFSIGNESKSRLDAPNSLDPTSVEPTKNQGRLYEYTKALMSVVEGYGLVGYLPLDVQNSDMMLRVTQEIDNAVGNFF